MSFYWITRLDAVVATSAVLAGILLTFATVWFFIGMLDDWDEKFLKSTIATAVVGFFFLLVAIFTPDTKTICAIYFVDYLQGKEEVRELPDKVIKSANLYFDKMIEEMQEQEEEK